MKTKNEMKRRILMMMVCLFTGWSAIAQVTCSREYIGQGRLIQSAEEYLTIQDSVQALAYTLFEISEAYPDFKYIHQTNDAGIIVAVSVVGISNAEIANRAATSLMTLEVLGEQVRTVDPTFLPAENVAVNGRLSQKEAMTYRPTPPRMKEQKNVIVRN